MKRHRPYWYLLFAIALAVVVLWMERPDRQPVRTTAPHPLFPGFAGERVVRLEIEHLLDGVELTQDNGAWQVRSRKSSLQQSVEESTQAATGTPATTAAAPSNGEAYPIDAALLQRALETLKTVEVAAPISRNAEQHDKLQVGKLALRVRAFDRDQTLLATLHIGSQGPDLLSSYVRAGDEATVFLARDQLRGTFPTQVNAWRDKTVWSLDADQITSIQAERRLGNFTLTKGADGLFVRSDLKDPKGLDVVKLREWMGQWTRLTAVELPTQTDAKTTGLDQPKERLTITLTDQSQQVLLLGNPSPRGSYHAKRQGNETVFILPSTFKTAFDTDPESWTVTPPPTDTPQP